MDATDQTEYLMKPVLLTGLALMAGVILFAPAPSHAADTLTFGTYNIHSGIPAGHNQMTYYPSAADARNIADVLTTMGASIVALQEVRNLSPAPEVFHLATPPNLPLLIAGLLDMNYAYISTMDAGHPMKENRTYGEWGNETQWTNNGAPHGEYGNALLSKYPMGQPTTIKLPLGDADAQTKGDEPRAALRSEIREVPGLGTIVVYSTHFQHNNGRTRKAQMQHLLEVAKADATTATVFLMGDFNHTPHPGEPDLLSMVKQAGFHDLAKDYADDTGTTLAPTIDSGIRIDYVFASKPLKVTDVKVLDTNVSDHYPLAVTIKP